eukprot:TRINITY_DN37176_c0_g5_i1.p1 TRINITY_DN37176_c0_g5~~TRINITY_DN37176_c0_g5_i1.p1  ORF type:complete len:643 (-),score=34.76 TRINITY_DN37176_c0_g5_i1:273-2201(-)
MRLSTQLKLTDICINTVLEARETSIRPHPSVIPPPLPPFCPQALQTSPAWQPDPSWCSLPPSQAPLPTIPRSFAAPSLLGSGYIFPQLFEQSFETTTKWMTCSTEKIRSSFTHPCTSDLEDTGHVSFDATQAVSSAYGEDDWGFALASTSNLHAEKGTHCETWLPALMWTAASVAVLFAVAAPLMFEKPSYVSEWEDHDAYRASSSARDFILGRFHKARRGVPFIGEYFGASFGAFFLVMKFWRGSNKTSQLRRWLKRYVVSMTISAIAAVVPAWLFVACPRDKVLPIYATSGAMFYLGYVMGQGCLGVVSVIRLRLIGQPAVASLARRTLTVAAALGMVSTGIYVVVVIGVLPEWVWWVAAGLFILPYFAFQLSVLVGLSRSFVIARQEVQMKQSRSKEVDSVRFIVISFVLSTGTTLASCVMTPVPTTSPWFFWLHTVIVTLDFFSDAVLALTCAGILGPAMDQERNLQAAGRFVEAAHQRQVLRALTEAARAITGPSVTLAALFEGRDPEELLKAGVARFRCISWETLRRHAFLVTGGSPLDGTTIAADLYSLSEPCQLGVCDAFLSHSWHDNGEEKWEAVSAWCTAFSEKHGRPPRLWFDKVCINQTDIQQDLPCLPIFLAGCKTLLVTCGATYTRRL